MIFDALIFSLLVLLIEWLLKKALPKMIILFKLIKYCLSFKNNFELEKNNVKIKKRHECIV